MKCCFLDVASMGEGVNFQSLEVNVDVVKLFDHTEPEQVDRHLENCDIVIVNKVNLTEEHFIRHPQLKLIAVTATGTNNIDIPAAKSHGIEVKNVTHYGTATIVQHVYSLILALANNLLSYHDEVRNNAWQKSQAFCMMNYPIRELAGSKLGVIGYGNLGRAVAAVAPAFGLEVLIGARPGKLPGKHDGVDFLPLETLLSEADIVSLHCLLSPETGKMINENTLALMKKDAFLINTARGGLIDEPALAEALKNHQLGGAALDVLSEEPPVRGNVLLGAEIPNLIITPHCAWASLQARQRIIDLTAQNIQEFIIHQRARGPM